MSFKDRQTFSLIPGEDEIKPEHVSQPVKGVSVLKTAVVFGANASGKSNLIKAMAFGKRLVLKGTNSEQEIDFQNFRLDSDCKKSNSRIEYEIQYRGKNYAYGFIFNRQRIVEEWLFEVTKKADIKIFERNSGKEDVFDLTELFEKNLDEEERQFLKFIAKGTPDNQLFLNEIRTRKVKENISDINDLLNVIDWFRYTLKFIFPEDKYNEGLKIEMKEDKKLLEAFNQFLTYFDTGIEEVSLEKVNVESVNIPSSLLNKIKEDMSSKKFGNAEVLISSGKNTTYILSVKESELIFHKFMTKHKVAGQENVELFDTADESDGTNRIIDFIPMMMDLFTREKVFVIDEMERSLHPNLIYDLIDLFLSKSTGTNSQLILSTHESSLLTRKLLRKDEIWFTVKDINRATQLYSLEQYNVDFDEHIRKDYLLGRFKAIPKFGNRNRLTVLPHLE